MVCESMKGELRVIKRKWRSVTVDLDEMKSCSGLETGFDLKMLD